MKGRLARGWLALVRRGQVRPEDAADVHALARAAQEHGAHRLTLGAVTFETPTPELLESGGRVLIATRGSDRFELDLADGSVWLAGQRVFEDLNDALCTYFEAKHDTSGLGDVLASIDLWDTYLAPEVREATSAAAREAEKNGGVGFLPVSELPEPEADPRPRITTHPVRTRVADRTVLEGWWQIGAAWLPRGELCVLCSEGEVELDREDPEVRSLASLEGAGLPTERLLRVSSAGLLHVVSTEGEYRYQISVKADRVQSTPDGRWVVLTRSSGAWRTAILAATPGGLVTIAKHPADIGTLVVLDGRAFGSGGFELLGIEAAAAAAPDGRINALEDTLALEAPPPPPPSTLKLDEGGVLRRRTDVEPPAAPDVPDLQAEIGWPQVLSTQRVGDRCWVLVRIHRADCEILRFDLRDGAWVRGPCIPVEGLDRLYAGARILALTIDNAPPDMAWTVFLSVTEGGEIAHAGRLHRSLSAMWDDADGTHVRLLSGACYTLPELEAPTRSLRAIVYDVKGHWGRRELLPRYDHDYGFIDARGELVIEHQFTHAFDFEGGHARAAHSGPRLFGLVDADGGCFVPHHYNWIGPLLGEHRRIGRGEADILGRPPAEATWGLLRRDGSVLLAPAERAVRDMFEGVAAVQRESGDWNLVDAHGRYLLPEDAPDCGDFAQDRCAVRRDELWGYVDREGHWVVEPRFLEARVFSEGVAVVAVAGDCRFIDPEGRLVGASFDEGHPHREGLSRVRRGERWGFADAAGELVIEYRFDQAFDFHCGFAAVRVGDKWTWTDKTGRLLFEPQFDRAFDFHDGVGVFQDGPLRGYASAAGDVLARGFEAAYDFREGRALVQQRARWGFLDATGELVIAPGFAGALGYSEGLAAVRSGGKWGFIDRAGTTVIPPRFVECGSFHQGRARVRRAA